MNIKKIAIIGLGYVGLPLAIEFSKKYKVYGFDISSNKIKKLISGVDTNLYKSEGFKIPKNLKFTNDLDDLKKCSIFIIAVPTPIDKNNNPDLSSLEDSSKLVGSIIKKNDIVIYESTVYPGTTEEICVPILEKISGLAFNEDFFCGYSPERINPGDDEHTLKTIVKVTSGSTPKVAMEIDNLYKEIVTAGTYLAPSIKVAEAAKIIENTQRDVNIALMNEFSIIFNKLKIDTESILEAANTKWNFLPFKPGLVGGHCIGVDPYYLAFKALEVGHKPEIILAGRRLNDYMGSYIKEEVIKIMISKEIKIKNSNILIMGVTFKENCSDIRNTRVLDLVNELQIQGCNVDICDPWANKKEILSEFKMDITLKPNKGNYDAIILAVAHEEFKKFSIKEIKEYGKLSHVIYDVKHLFKQNEVDGRL